MYNVTNSMSTRKRNKIFQIKRVIRIFRERERESYLNEFDGLGGKIPLPVPR